MLHLYGFEVIISEHAMWETSPETLQFPMSFREDTW